MTLRRPPSSTGPKSSALRAFALREETLVDRLKRGEISQTEYLDLRVEEALAPHAARLDQKHLEFLRQTLREQLATDPQLIELTGWVRRLP
jgi:hypothetical protein